MTASREAAHSQPSSLCLLAVEEAASHTGTAAAEGTCWHGTWDREGRQAVVLWRRGPCADSESPEPRIPRDVRHHGTEGGLPGSLGWASEGLAGSSSWWEGPRSCSPSEQARSPKSPPPRAQ